MVSPAFAFRFNDCSEWRVRRDRGIEFLLAHFPVRQIDRLDGSERVGRLKQRAPRGCVILGIRTFT